MKGISAVIATILMLMITMALAGVAYFYISGIFASKTTIIEAVWDASVTKAADGTCSITWNVRNTGTAAVSITIDSTVGDACTNDPSSAPNVGGGATQPFTASACTSGRNHVYKAKGPSNTVSLIAFCA